MVAKSLWYSWVTLSHENTSPTKTNREKVIFLTESENRRIHQMTFPLIRLLIDVNLLKC